MEKMFVYPETLDSKVARDVHRDDVENAYSKSAVASHRCKLYRTLLEQRTASRKAALVGMDDERAAHGAYA
jgi:predicted kinase